MKGKLAIVIMVLIAAFVFYNYSDASFVKIRQDFEAYVPTKIMETIDNASEKIIKAKDSLQEDLPQIGMVTEEIEQKLSQATESFKPEFDASRMENLIHLLTNEQRLNHELPLLADDTALDKIARKHSTDMASRDYFSHITPDGLDPSDRAKNSDYLCKKFYVTYYTEGIAENIAQNWLFKSYFARGTYFSYNWHTEESLAQEIVDGWMNSTGHRKNILTPAYDKLGVGISIDEDNAVFATQNFC